MSNVIQLTFPSRRDQRAASLAALLETFALHRRRDGDVFWMKENAEVLNILECTGQAVPPEALSVYANFYDTIEERMEFFPQYYRFLLSICQDLEALGMAGDKSHRLAQWVADQGLVEAELSDLQRGEACRLLARCGVTATEDPDEISRRLRKFAARPETFAVPNKKAAYELTHIVFYLTEYGRQKLDADTKLAQSLKYTGTMAFLDCNFDLLAEVLVAMSYCGVEPPLAWTEALARSTARFAVSEGDDAVVQDDYHEYLVCNWALSESGEQPFSASIRPGPVSFHAPLRAATPLREMSEILHGLRHRRSSDWSGMRDYLCDSISAASADVLLTAEHAVDGFESFFEGFARTGLRAAAPEAKPA